jgi:phosphoribosylformylglycinamidine synthase II
MTEAFEELGLKKEEYMKIIEILGRVPNYLELSLFSVMWSEHCGYKHSKKALKQLPTEAPWVIQGPGENAGIVDIGGGYTVVFKMESHNHPSAIEPYQGAATGIGGILRDIFAMGARPIALLDPLRFGSLKKPRVKYLFEEVVAGIAGYGNCVGVPTVGGDVYFEDSYEGNPLVNVMCVGLAKKDNLISGVAKGPGNLVVLIGSKTGRDGIHGCTFASEELSEESEARRPAVQVGDPFTEKLLIEACLGLLKEELLVALQDLGAAGITSSSSEMAAKGGVGMDIDVSKVPRREENMVPFEVMISESQERMLAIVKPKNIDDVLALCEKWGLDATVIGKITKSNNLRIFDGDKMVGEVPVVELADEAPQYDPEATPPSYLKKIEDVDFNTLENPPDLNEFLKEFISLPNLCSKEWVYRQYDHMVQTNTAVFPGTDAAILRIKETNKAIALTTDCNGRYCFISPYIGAQMALAESARNVVVSGAKPLAITDCLNFGSPEDPEIFWQFKEAVKGLAVACEKMDIPVVSGNVSFYNESFEKAVYPTPAIGLVGLVEDLKHITTHSFKNVGDLIYLIGENDLMLGGSEYIKLLLGKAAGKLPPLDLEYEIRLQNKITKLIRKNILVSAHDISEGGLVISLIECCMQNELGIEIKVPDKEEMMIPFLFSEAPSRVIVSVKNKNASRLERICKRNEIACNLLGNVAGNKVIIGDRIELEVSEIKKIWNGALEKHIEK